MGSDAEIFAILGRIHVLLRRDLNRITDIEWARHDKGYARELVRLCGTGSNADLALLASKLELALELGARPASMPAAAAPPVAQVTPLPQRPGLQAPLPAADRPAHGPRYLGGLR